MDAQLQVEFSPCGILPLAKNSVKNDVNYPYFLRQNRVLWTLFFLFLTFDCWDKQNGKYVLGICSISCSHSPAFSFIMLLNSSDVVAWPCRGSGEWGQQRRFARSGCFSFCRNVWLNSTAKRTCCCSWKSSPYWNFKYMTYTWSCPLAGDVFILILLKLQIKLLCYCLLFVRAAISIRYK